MFAEVDKRDGAAGRERDWAPPSELRHVVPREAAVAMAAATLPCIYLVTKGLMADDGELRIAMLLLAMALIAGASLVILALANAVWARLPPQWSRFRFITHFCVLIALTVIAVENTKGVLVLLDLPVDGRRAIQGSIILMAFYTGVLLIIFRLSRRLGSERAWSLQVRAAGLDARVQSLQARTNPHFFFNTLNSILSLIAIRPREAEELVERLAALMRYTLEGDDTSMVPLADELSVVRAYLDIEKVRFADKLNATIEVAADVPLTTLVPRMVLQPLVENAVLHGSSRSLDGGTVHIAASVRDSVLELTVDDDGTSDGVPMHKGTGTSMRNLEERLAILYGARAAITAGPRTPRGYRAHVALPMRGAR